MRVLVVEDDERMARAVRRGLQAEGFAVDVAPDGTEGLWHATEFLYDAIVLDVMLPRIDGYEVCRRLRAADNWAPILMLTAHRWHLAGCNVDRAGIINQGRVCRGCHIHQRLSKKKPVNERLFSGEKK